MELGTHHPLVIPKNHTKLDTHHEYRITNFKEMSHGNEVRRVESIFLNEEQTKSTIFS